jgi:hypothetical protein
MVCTVTTAYALPPKNHIGETMHDTAGFGIIMRQRCAKCGEKLDFSDYGIGK